MAINPIKAKSIRALNDDVLVSDMDMGEMITAGGIVIQSDDGKAHGVKPRWAKVYCVGPKQTDVKVGQWIFIEHGRWTRKMSIEIDNEVKEVQKVEVKSIIAVSDERPNTAYLGIEHANGSGIDIRPEDFMPGNLSKIN